MKKSISSLTWVRKVVSHMGLIQVSPHLLGRTNQLWAHGLGQQPTSNKNVMLLFGFYYLHSWAFLQFMVLVFHQMPLFKASFLNEYHSMKRLKSNTNTSSLGKSKMHRSGEVGRMKYVWVKFKHNYAKITASENWCPCGRDLTGRKWSCWRFRVLRRFADHHKEKNTIHVASSAAQSCKVALPDISSISNHVKPVHLALPLSGPRGSSINLISQHFRGQPCCKSFRVALCWHTVKLWRKRPLWFGEIWLVGWLVGFYGCLFGFFIVVVVVAKLLPCPKLDQNFPLISHLQLSLHLKSREG